MNKKNLPQEAKKFKYPFTKAMIALAVGVILLCLVGIILSVYRLTLTGIQDFSDVLKSPFLIAICVFCIVIVVALLIKSQYLIVGTDYVVQFGLIKSKYPIQDITSLALDSDSQKLTVFVGEQFSVLTLSSAWSHDFIAALRTVKPEIDFTFTLAESKDEKK